MKCSICNDNEATKHKRFGYLPCRSCTNRHQRFTKVKPPIELTTESIKTQRKEWRDSTWQPFRSGVVSKEYIQKYGTKRIKASETDIKNAENVWAEDSYYQP